MQIQTRNTALFGVLVVLKSIHNIGLAMGLRGRGKVSILRFLSVQILDGGGS